MKDPQAELTVQYFDYLAKCFPVMCASDEFHFLPRAEMASQYYDQLDNLDRHRIHECLSTLKEFQNRCDLMAAHETDLEKLTDLELLKANAAGILIELEMKESWRYNPLLYLKIAFIGLDHALTKPASEAEEKEHRVLARLRAMPRLLEQAMNNIDSVPKTYHEAALSMLTDCKDYLTEISKRDADASDRLLSEGLQQTWSALDAFRKFLGTLSPVPDQQFVVSALEATLNDHFRSVRSLPEVFQIADDEWRENLEQLKKLQANIDPGKSWRELYHAYSPSDVEKKDTISLYQHEIERLGRFFREHGFCSLDLNASLELRETPTYLRSVRSSASFSAAFSADVREKDFFYMTTQLEEQRGKEAAESVRKRLHREYKFLAAHETFPGHHLLDTVRRKLKNPVRRQIESPLFYEGWAYYAESLLSEYGYVSNPIEYLVDCKRRLWRAARCKIDVGLTTDMLARKDAVRLVTSAGFSPEEADYQIDHFQLNPGYQLCYSLGRYEIMQLRETYGMKMGLEQFHRQLLEGGELPFHFIQKRFKALNRSGTE
ncbi:MAG: DUF885 family protein [Desulfobacterales bacterium]|nr:MAG: DUF885 family protein [Desulfobacterales bacterium]